MLTALVEKAFVRVLRGEITDEEAADQIADSLCADSLTNNLQNIYGAEIQRNVNNEGKMDISANLQPQSCQQHQQQPKVLGTITLGDLHPAQIAQFQQAFAEASKGLASSVVFNVPVQKTDSQEEYFTDEDKERCALLHELLSGRRPLILHPYVFLLNRRFKWTDIAVPVTETDKFRVYRLNQARNSRCYYRCSGCETMAKEPGDPIAQIKLAEGHLVGDVNPPHNLKCELFTFSNIVNRQFDREARLDVYNGIMNPKEAWNRGRLRALRAESLAPKGLLNADEYPTWDTMNKVIMKLWRSAKRAHDAGIEGIDRVGSKDWWRNIPPPSATRRSAKKKNYDTTNYSFRTEGSGELEELDDDDGDQSCISMAASGENGCLELLDVVSESEIYTTDQEPAPSVSFEGDNIMPEPPEQISLFSNRSDPGKCMLHQDNHISLSALPSDGDEKTPDAFARDGEENSDVQYYLLQDYDDDDDDDDDNDDDDDDDDDNDGGDDDDDDGGEDRDRNGDDEDDNDNDVDVDNVDQVTVDNADDEVMREYNDVLTEVDRLERKAIAATEGMTEHRRMGGGHIVEQRQHDESYELRRNIQQVPLHEHVVARSQQVNSTVFANRKLFAAIESLTRTLNTDHSRQFHQEMLKTAVELSNSYAAQQRQRYAAETVTLRRNATVERRNVAEVSRQHSDYEEDEKSFGKITGRRQASATPLRTWAFKKGSKFE